ncbi:MAG: translocation protein Sec62-domain-containing protein [Olpidium bornovanus]|uniref:Translocation protein SEC62 n=1 Tax=Olpidium bornovanus TaxID=278681 RepID=A0A8H7ZVK4_9FUNG|nr:MAG: translocation protein Sec62-domain-containing protein [Olpidium bornovanus]
MFLGCEKDDRTLNVLKTQAWSDDTYYVWLYQGSQAKQVLAGIALVLVVMAGVMFPLWPPVMRNGVWYLSVGVLCLLGLFFLLAIFRLFFYVITLVLARPGIWIFPNLFEDVGIIESFIPLWAWDVPPPTKKKAAASSSATTASGGGAGGARKEGTVEIEDEAAGDWDEAGGKDIEDKKTD